MAKLLLFDVDGTLILTGGAGVRAMNRAFFDAFGAGDAFTGVSMAGRTDSAIIDEVLVRLDAQVDASDLSRLHERYFVCLREEIQHSGPRKGIMPGVRTLLDILAARNDVNLAIVTGNLADAARIKLEHFDLWRYFPCGAYGDDNRDRNELVPIARNRVRALLGREFDSFDIFVVGDTPLDVECASAAGVRAVAVATGSSDVAALRAAGADVVFEDLSDTQAFLKLL